MSWKVIIHEKQGDSWRIEVGIEAPEGGWEQVRVANYADSDFSGTAESIKKQQCQEFKARIAAEYVSALESAVPEPEVDVAALPDL